MILEGKRLLITGVLTRDSLAFHAAAAAQREGATVPTRLLRCVLNCEEMVSLKTAHFDAVRAGDGIMPTNAPGLGITVDHDVLGPPTRAWGD